MIISLVLLFIMFSKFMIDRLFLRRSGRQLSYSVRAANSSDIAAIDSCNRRNLPENYSQSFYDNHLAKWADISLIAESKNKDVVGYVLGRVEQKPLRCDNVGSLFETRVDVGHVASLTVDMEYRKQGVARKLMQQLHTRIAEHYGMNTITLYCRVSNIAAVNLYTKVLKYDVKYVINGYYQDGENACFMEHEGLMLSQPPAPSSFLAYEQQTRFMDNGIERSNGVDVPCGTISIQ